MGHGYGRDDFWDLSLGQFIAVFESVAVISRQQHDLIEEERAKNESPQQAIGGAAAQEARGMRPGGSPAPSKPPGPRQRSAPTPRGVRKGNAMDALQIFGAMAGGN